jgi:hypothetical protein
MFLSGYVIADLIRNPRRFGRSLVRPAWIPVEPGMTGLFF